MSYLRTKSVHINRFQNTGACKQFKRHENYWYRPRTLYGSSGRFGTEPTARLEGNYYSRHSIANRGFERYKTNECVKRKLENDGNNDRERKIIKFDYVEDAKFLQRIQYILQHGGNRAVLKELSFDSVSVHNLEIFIDYIYREACIQPNQTFKIHSINDLALLCKECKDITASNRIENCTFESLLFKKITSQFERLVHLKQRIRQLANRSKDAGEERKNKWIQLQYEQYLPQIKKLVYGSFKFIRYLFRYGVMSTEKVNSLMKSLIDAPYERNLECLQDFLKIIGKENEFQLNDLAIDHPNPQFVELFNRIRAMIDEPNCTEKEKSILVKIIELDKKSKVSDAIDEINSLPWIPSDGPLSYSMDLINRV